MSTCRCDRKSAVYTANPEGHRSGCPARPRADYYPKAADAIERGTGICRTCLAPIWNEGGTVGHRKRVEGWSDRIETGADSLVCFKAIDYRHVPLTGREAAIYDCAYERGTEATT